MTKVSLNVNQQKTNIASDVLPGKNVQTVGTHGRVLKSDATDTFTKSTFVPSDKKSGIISITVGTEKPKVKSLKADAKAKAKAMAQQQAEVSANNEARAIERVAKENAKDVAFAEETAGIVNRVLKSTEPAKAFAPTAGEPGGPRMIADAFRKAEEVAAQAVDKAKKTVPQATETAKKSSNKVIAGIAIALAVLGGALGIKHVNDKNQNKFDVAA